MEGRRREDHTDEDVDGWLLDATADLFQQACGYGRDRGVSITVEVHPFTLGINVDWLVQLCDRIADPNFSVT